MNTSRVLKQSVLLIGVIGMLANLAYADEFKRRDDRHDGGHSTQYERGNWRNQRSHEQVPKDYRLDSRYSHDRYYPRRGYNVTRLPPKHYTVRYHDSHYYFRDGIWYRPSGSRFVVVAPPIGVVVPFLPAFYTTIWFGGVPYYYANDVYYVWNPAHDGYVVTNPPPNIDEQQPALVPDELYIYPKQGQSAQQQADDRFACHQWSVKQTNYDPTQPPGNMSQGDINNKREAYQRAMRACLEGRGYSVR